MIHVLIIEDDQFLRDLLKTKLEREDFRVTTAIDGPEGWKKLEAVRADVVLLDIILPGFDGFEILMRARKAKDGRLANLPIILLTNLGQEADVLKGRSLGANDYLIKSNFTIDEIIQKIKKVLDRPPHQLS